MKVLSGEALPLRSRVGASPLALHRPPPELCTHRAYEQSELLTQLLRPHRTSLESLKSPPSLGQALERVQNDESERHYESALGLMRYFDIFIKYIFNNYTHF